MTMPGDAPSDPAAALDASITWLLDHARVSDWLKAALRSGRDFDPMVLQSDLQLLSFVLGRRIEAQIDAALEPLR